MAITINGSGTITGISQGGLPDDVITANDIKDSDYQAPLTAGTDYLAPNGDGSSLTNLPGGGKVLQVRFLRDTTQVVETGTSPSATDIKYTITPTASDSKVLVSFIGVLGLSETTNMGRIYIKRTIDGANETIVYNNSATDDVYIGGYLGNGNTRTHVKWSIQFLDSPATTGVCEYVLWCRPVDGGGISIGRWYYDTSPVPTDITLTEIGA